ncbi:MAG: hypothetical protein M4579_003440 [Chaenotheca gracillima]|nr:MAG: hypothetical protein M4579_003440 [Chaenotheca gracillima]
MSLNEKLAEALPTGLELSVYHISSPRTRCEPIFSAPPGHDPEQTRCESHLLYLALPPRNVDIAQDGEKPDRPAQELLVYAIEVLIYTTSKLTTLFVSKADSTGYLSLLKLPPRTSSPLKTVSTIFISHLINVHRRPGVKLAVSLFARAQDQYLFPGSSENKHKHVLDDRNLIKWWCRVLDPLVRPDVTALLSPKSSQTTETTSSRRPQAYLLIPGLDRYETQSLLPPTAKHDPPSDKRWLHGHPLREISQNSSSVPPRCLIPHFPDDPKARFLDQLDEELSEPSKPSKDVNSTLVSPSKRPRPIAAGEWRSVRTLEQFWEAMEFRQECSSGRAVGFIWVVFPQTSEGGGDANPPTRGPHLNDANVSRSLPTPASSQGPRKVRGEGLRSAQLDPRRSSPSTPSSRPRHHISSPRRTRTGPILPLVQHRELYHRGRHSPAHSSRQKYVASVDNICVSQSTYTRSYELSLRLDFATDVTAIASTKRWITEIGAAVTDPRQKPKWGAVITGRNAVKEQARVNQGEPGIHQNSKVPVATTTQADAPGSASNVNVLSTSLVRKKKRKSGEAEVETDHINTNSQLQPESLVPAPAASAPGTTSQVEDHTQTRDAGVNVLGAGLVRKKKKTSP